MLLKNSAFRMLIVCSTIIIFAGSSQLLHGENTSGEVKYLVSSEDKAGKLTRRENKNSKPSVNQKKGKSIELSLTVTKKDGDLLDEGIFKLIGSTWGGGVTYTIGQVNDGSGTINLSVNEMENRKGGHPENFLYQLALIRSDTLSWYSKGFGHDHGYQFTTLFDTPQSIIRDLGTVRKDSATGSYRLLLDGFTKRSIKLVDEKGNPAKYVDFSLSFEKTASHVRRVPILLGDFQTDSQGLAQLHTHRTPPLLFSGGYKIRQTSYGDTGYYPAAEALELQFDTFIKVQRRWKPPPKDTYTISIEGQLYDTTTIGLWMSSVSAKQGAVVATGDTQNDIKLSFTPSFYQTFKMIEYRITSEGYGGYKKIRSKKLTSEQLKTWFRTGKLHFSWEN